MSNKNECPCGSAKSYDSCCAKYISGKELPPTAEALMRSRYSAYVKKEIEYVDKTHDPDSEDKFDLEMARNWAEKSEWLGLEIISTEGGQATDSTGIVEFSAKFSTEGKEYQHHENSSFVKKNGRWFYVDGKTVSKPVLRSGPKIGRNDPCSCGSGVKFKKCCAAA